MTAVVDQNLRFEVETSRLLQILSTEIYDSPNALLRENLQNAYDAILMRCKLQNLDLKEQKIEIIITPQTITVRDYGIGMTKDVLENNFWKAGSSGKRTDLARRSGVIGTFGIGAMANFGVCTTLTVETKSVDSNSTLITSAHRDSLSIGEQCIDFQVTQDDREPGTTVIAALDSAYQIDDASAIGYLQPYVRHVPVAVTVNGRCISQVPLVQDLANTTKLDSRSFEVDLFRGSVDVYVDRNSRVYVHATDVRMDSEKSDGELMLSQAGGQVMAMRTYFGLAPAPISGFYQLGGIANLPFLRPTAGREALSRESIQHLNTLITKIESTVSQVLAETSHGDANAGFLTYIHKRGPIEHAKNVTIEAYPDRQQVPMANVPEHAAGKSLHYYGGRDPETIRMHSSTKACLLHLSQGNPRRAIQERYLTQILGINAIPDDVQIRKEYSPSDLDRREISFLIKIGSVLATDYLIPDVDVAFAEITHGVEFKVDRDEKNLRIYIARGMPAIPAVLNCYDTAYDLFGAFVRDFVRNHLYERISQHVPSSTKQGAEALFTLLKQNRELYRIELEDRGEMESMIADWLDGEEALGTVLRNARPQSQRVTHGQVGSVEQELPGIVDAPAAVAGAGQFDAAPAIMRDDLKTAKKILTVAKQYSQLNGFQLFLGLSDRFFRRERGFFQYPHTTKILWGGHRVVYIFEDATRTISLYYDIELKSPFDIADASGTMIRTTTLYTKERIFVPVPHELDTAFRVVDSPKEFFVRFDSVP